MTVTQSTTGTASSSPATATSSSSTSDAAGKSLSTEICEPSREAAIGAGVGIPLSIAALSLLGLWLRERTLRKRERELSRKEGALMFEGNYRPDVKLPQTVFHDRTETSELGGSTVGELP
jgi:hypothetical protein